MALYKYFSPTSKNFGNENTNLPDPKGPLKDHILSQSIQLANEEVSSVIKATSSKSGRSKRGVYNVYTAEEKATVGKRASEMGVTNSLRFFNKKDFLEHPLKETTVRTWARQYEAELAKCKREGDDMIVKELPCKKKGRPLLLGNELDRRVREYVTALRESGAVVNTAIVIAAAWGIVKSYDSNLLKCNGGHIECNKHWVLGFLERLGYVKRRANTKAKVSVVDFEEYKAQFVFDICTIMDMEDIPKEMIVNWDHTGMNYVPVSSWMMAKEGSKRVEIRGLTDKRQLTLVLAGSMTGDFLPLQVIYGGSTKRCIPNVTFPEDWDVTFTPNHWANEATTESYISKIMVPYFDKKRSLLGLAQEHPALVIFDRFKGQCTDKIYSLLEENHIYFTIVPPNCTDRLQPLDVSVNKSVKEFMRGEFQQWYANEVCKQLADNPYSQQSCSVNVDLKMSIVKPIGARWLINLYHHFLS